jgi:hypothetical protein
VQSV